MESVVVASGLQHGVSRVGPAEGNLVLTSPGVDMLSSVGEGVDGPTRHGVILVGPVENPALPAHPVGVGAKEHQGLMHSQGQQCHQQ